MRTTVRLNESLMSAVKQYAAEHGITLTSLIEESLAETLARQKSRPRTTAVKLTTVRGSGLMPGVDLDDSASLLDLMDGPRDPS